MEETADVLKASVPSATRVVAGLDGDPHTTDRSSDATAEEEALYLNRRHPLVANGLRMLERAATALAEESDRYEVTYPVLHLHTATEALLRGRLAMHWAEGHLAHPQRRPGQQPPCARGVRRPHAARGRRPRRSLVRHGHRGGTRRPPGFRVRTQPGAAVVRPRQRQPGGDPLPGPSRARPAARPGGDRHPRRAHGGRRRPVRACRTTLPAAGARGHGACPGGGRGTAGVRSHLGWRTRRSSSPARTAVSSRYRQGTTRSSVCCAGGISAPPPTTRPRTSPRWRSTSRSGARTAATTPSSTTPRPPHGPMPKSMCACTTAG